MSCGAVYSKVQTGPYAGFTRAEMLTEFARYKAALQTSGSRLIGSSITGNSFQFGSRSDWTLTEWGRQVRAALAQVDPDYIAPQHTIQVRFGCS